MIQFYFVDYSTMFPTSLITLSEFNFTVRSFRFLYACFNSIWYVHKSMWVWMNIYSFISIFQAFQDIHLSPDPFIFAYSLCTSVMGLFAYAYFGTYATTVFSKHADYLFESEWCELPVQLQKFILLMIFNSQRSQCYKGNGLFLLDLPFFKKVLLTLHM